MIYGERIRLRAVERDDIPLFTAWLNDPQVIEGLTQVLPFSTAEEERWFERQADRPAAERPLAIDRRRGRGWQLIGNSGFHDLSPTARSAEIGLFIGEKSLWDQGYGTETVRLLLQHGFETLNLHRICLRVHADNARAMRAYEKAGFVLEGRLRQAVYQHGNYIDCLVMSVLRNEWDARRT